MKKIFAIAFGVLALAACHRDAQPAKAGAGSEVKFTTSFNTYTVKAGETALEGKTVQIIAGAPLSTAVAATAEGNALTPATKIYWQDGQTETTTFAAVYQREGDAPTSLSIPYSIDNDDLDFHGSYLTAVAKDVTPETTVALAFKHPFAKITVTVDNQLEGTPEVSAPVFDGLVISGTIDLAEDKVVLGDDETSVTTIAQEVGAFETIILPQSAKPVLSVTAGEKTFVFALPAAVNFEANKAYAVNLTLTDSTPVIEDGEEVAFTFTVADWESAGEALAYEDVTDALYVSGTIYQGTKPETAWAEDYQMTKGEDGKYSITVTYDESLAGEDDSARGFLVFKVNWTAKWGLWSEGEQMNIAYDYGTLANGYNIRLATVAEEVWTPVAGEVTITFNPADNKLVVTTE